MLVAPQDTMWFVVLTPLHPPVRGHKGRMMATAQTQAVDAEDGASVSQSMLIRADNTVGMNVLKLLTFMVRSLIGLAKGHLPDRHS